MNGGEGNLGCSGWSLRRGRPEVRAGRRAGVRIRCPLVPDIVVSSFMVVSVSKAGHLPYAARLHAVLLAGNTQQRAKHTVPTAPRLRASGGGRE